MRHSLNKCYVIVQIEDSIRWVCLGQLMSTNHTIRAGDGAEIKPASHADKLSRFGSFSEVPEGFADPNSFEVGD